MIERYSLPEMAAIWSPARRLELWQQVEVEALAGWAALDVVPSTAADAVRTAAVDATAVAAREEVTRHDVAAFVDVLATEAGEHGRWVHYGLTSSDVLDTALAVQLRDAADLLLRRVGELFAAVKARAREHRGTVMAGRTHGVWAEPTTFGAKLAGWGFELERTHRRLAAARAAVAVGKVSGAVGNYGSVPPDVEAHVCTALGIEAEPAATQVVARDRHAEYLGALGLLGSSLERFATEIRHLQRSEVAEVAEGFTAGQKGSSAMPHKRNPIGSENVTGLARLLRAYAGAGLEDVALWHERDISHSSVERVALPDASLLADFALVRLTDIVGGLVVDAEQMDHNLVATNGLVFSGAVLSTLVEEGLRRDAAYRIVQRAAARTAVEGVHFGDALEDDPEMPLEPKVLEELFNVQRVVSNAAVLVDRLEALELG